MADSSSLNLDEVYEFAVELGKEAGAMLMKAAEARFGGLSESSHTEKDNAVDLVTQTDIGEWKMFIRRLVKIQPEILYLGLLGRVESIHQEADLKKT